MSHCQASATLVELAGREEAARRDEHLEQLLDHRGLADTGKAGNQDQFGRAGRYHAVECGDHGVDLALAPVQLLGDQQPELGAFR
jgi:hypothetical protein